MTDELMKYRTQAIDPSILSVYDVASDGKVVSAQIWTELWQLVIGRINTIAAFCVSIKDIQLAWQETKEAVDQMVIDLSEKYDALTNAFVHYGTSTPPNEYYKFWVVPCNDINPYLVVNKSEFNKGLDTKVDRFNSVSSGQFIIDLERAVQISDSTEVIAERYYASEDILDVGVTVSIPKVGVAPDKATHMFEGYSLAKGTLLTVVYTKRIIDGVSKVFATVTADAPWLVTSRLSQSTIPVLGQLVVQATRVNSYLEEVSAQFYKTDSIAFTRANVDVMLKSSDWTQQGTNKLYTQVITRLSNVTPQSKVDPAPTPEQLASFYENGNMFVVENRDTTLTIYCIGNKPTVDIEMPLTITEVYG